jgi:hypothetical protein
LKYFFPSRINSALDEDINTIVCIPSMTNEMNNMGLVEKIMSQICKLEPLYSDKLIY